MRDKISAGPLPYVENLPAAASCHLSHEGWKPKADKAKSHFLPVEQPAFGSETSNIRLKLPQQAREFEN